MRWPRPRFTIGRFLVGVAILAVIFALTIDPDRPGLGITILLAAVLIAVAGVWAVRHPWIASGLGLVIFLATPAVDHPGLMELLLGLGGLALFTGAGVNWAPRLYRRVGPS